MPLGAQEEVKVSLHDDFQIIVSNCHSVKLLYVELGSRSVPRLSAELACSAAVLGAESGRVAEIGGC